MANLFTSQTPTLTDINEAAPLTVATALYFTTSGTVTGGRFFAPLTVGVGTFTLKLWSIDTSDPGTGTLLASKTLGTPTAGVWNSAAFDTPVTVSANTAYRVGVGMSIGRYTATSLFFASSLTNGDIVGLANDGTIGGITARNGTFVGSETGFPTSQFNTSCYFVDVDFTADTGAIGSGALTLPAVTVSAAGAASASGSSALTLPALTASGTGTASATGSGTPMLPAVTISGFDSLPSAPGPVIRTVARDRTLRTSTRGG